MEDCLRVTDFAGSTYNTMRITSSKYTLNTVPHPSVFTPHPWWATCTVTSSERKAAAKVSALEATVAEQQAHMDDIASKLSHTGRRAQTVRGDWRKAPYPLATPLPYDHAPFITPPSLDIAHDCCAACDRWLSSSVVCARCCLQYRGRSGCPCTMTRVFYPHECMRNISAMVVWGRCRNLPTEKMQLAACKRKLALFRDNLQHHAASKTCSKQNYHKRNCSWKRCVVCAFHNNLQFMQMVPLADKQPMCMWDCESVDCIALLQ